MHGRISPLPWAIRRLWSIPFFFVLEKDLECLFPVVAELKSKSPLSLGGHFFPSCRLSRKTFTWFPVLAESPSFPSRSPPGEMSPFILPHGGQIFSPRAEDILLGGLDCFATANRLLGSSLRTLYIASPESAYTPESALLPSFKFFFSGFFSRFSCPH